jgi:hypothetical protein
MAWGTEYGVLAAFGTEEFAPSSVRDRAHPSRSRHSPAGHEFSLPLSRTCCGVSFLVPVPERKARIIINVCFGTTLRFICRLRPVRWSWLKRLIS